MAGAWDLALDRIETDLAALEEALDAGAAAPARDATALPAEPLPAALGARAEALLQRTHTLETHAATEMGAIQQALRALAGRRPPASAPTGRIVDVGA